MRNYWQHFSDEWNHETTMLTDRWVIEYILFLLLIFWMLVPVLRFGAFFALNTYHRSAGLMSTTATMQASPIQPPGMCIRNYRDPPEAWKKWDWRLEYIHWNVGWCHVKQVALLGAFRLGWIYRTLWMPWESQSYLLSSKVALEEGYSVDSEWMANIFAKPKGDHMKPRLWAIPGSGLSGFEICHPGTVTTTITTTFAHQETSGWKVTGPCSVLGDCVQSGNYPQEYGDSDWRLNIFDANFRVSQGFTDFVPFHFEIWAINFHQKLNGTLPTDP